jgi:hypothetical protein
MLALGDQGKTATPAGCCGKICFAARAGWPVGEREPVSVSTATPKFKTQRKAAKPAGCCGSVFAVMLNAGWFNEFFSLAAVNRAL